MSLFPEENESCHYLQYASITPFISSLPRLEDVDLRCEEFLLIITRAEIMPTVGKQVVIFVSCTEHISRVRPALPSPTFCMLDWRMKFLVKDKDGKRVDGGIGRICRGWNGDPDGGREVQGTSGAGQG